jgi:hypothetical protein
MASIRLHLLAGALVAALFLVSQAAHAQSSYVAAPHPEYPGTTSYWTPGDAYGNWRASLYPAPVPAPAYVGHVFYTYEPLYPHHSMYGHSHCYWQFPCKRCGRWKNWSHVHVKYSTW